MATAINLSDSLVALKDDWDGEGSLGYARQTVERAQSFLAANAETLWNEIGLVVPTPTIGPGPEGSVDVHWRKANRELLINFPAGSSTLAGFYGDDGKQEIQIKGKLSFDAPSVWILLWLMNK